MLNPLLTEQLRQDFPLLQTTMQGHPLIYFDNAATTQKPIFVIKALQDFYQIQYSNVHRGAYALSEQATDLFEKARQKVQRFINAKHRQEIVFTHGTTEAINLVANSYGKKKVQANDEILISYMEHHANILPWQQLCHQTGAVLKVIPVNANGELCLDVAHQLLNQRTKILSITHLSNLLGTLNPVKQLISWAHQKNIPVLLDGAQAIAHQKIDVQSLDCDFYTFSGHKLYGPTGIGILYGKLAYLNKMPPWQVGGGMIEKVSFETTTYQEPPHRFEAGTPSIAEAVGLGAAIDYLSMIDFPQLLALENTVTQYAIEKLSNIPFIQIIGNPKHRTAVISFVMEGIHAHDVATSLATQGIAVRAGHHCNMPLMDYLQLSATTRISFGLYNTKEEVDRLIHALKEVNNLFTR